MYDSLRPLFKKQYLISNQKSILSRNYYGDDKISKNCIIPIGCRISNNGGQVNPALERACAMKLSLWFENTDRSRRLPQVRVGSQVFLPLMPRKLSTEGASICEKTICPSPEELSIITDNVKCEQCGLVFTNESRYRLHDLKVHQHKKLSKITRDNVRYHCPVQSCVYAVNSQRYFSTMKYLKQVSI